MSTSADTSFIPDLPSGALDVYRKKNFDWKRLRLIFEEQSVLKIKYHVWNTLEKDPLFRKPSCSLPMDEQKRRAANQVNRVNDYEFAPKEIQEAAYKPRIRHLMSVNEALHAICPNLSIKIALGVGLFTNAILAMGTERHMPIFKAAFTREVVTCLAITEVSHGSNTKRIRTTATYDPKTQEFIIHTPDFEAAKCWVGNLGKTATVALAFAILYTADGQNHGLHGFLIPIRDPNTFQPYPGVLVGDIGEKCGLNGIDNGFVMFNNYRIPRINLLNRTGDVTEEGNYESVFTDPTKMLGAALESFSAGRLGIMQEASNTISHAVVIAVRYAAIRKQFGYEKDGPEVPIIEYQLHQWRIFPYLAAACVLKVSVFELTEIYLETIAKSQKDSNGFELLSQAVAEIHALVTASKAISTWTTRDAIQECREACGGHGYLKAANLGDLRNNHDPSVTYEGDNNVLGQQASNWLLRQWNEKVESPFGMAEFINRRNEILKQTFKEVISVHRNRVTIEFILQCFEWLMCHLLSTIANEVQNAKENGKNLFKTRNDTQVYKARTLTRALAEYYNLRTFLNRSKRSDVTPDLQPVLEQIQLIYGLWSLDKHLATFYIGGFATGSNFGDLIRQELLKLCGEIKDMAVTIADAIAPPDWVLCSVLGKSDGKLYDNIQKAFMTNPGAMERAEWWQEILPRNTKAKL
uniref:Acyl-coenzyme A oxidase n=1 Tax=Culicoides sonorensis TaxID=179676 RepID=A0A336MWM8_CULSO